MTRHLFTAAGVAGLSLLALTPAAEAQDWPAWGGGETRNMASTASST